MRDPFDTSNSTSDKNNRHWYSTKTVKVIAGRSLDDWREFARRDDCLDLMVPSELRQLLAAIPDA